MDHPGSAGATIPKTPPPQIPARPSNKSVGKTIYLIIFRRTPIVTYANASKPTRAPCRRNPERREDKIPHATNLEIQLQQITKFSMKRTNRHCIIDMRSWFKNWPQSSRCRNKTAQDTMKSVQRFLDPESTLAVTYTDKSSEFSKTCEDLSWNHDKSTHIDPKRMESPSERSEK